MGNPIGLLKERKLSHDTRIYLEVQCWAIFTSNKTYRTYPEVVLPDIKYPRVLFDGEWHALQFTVTAGRLRYFYVDGKAHKSMIWVKEYQTISHM